MSGKVEAKDHRSESQPEKHADAAHGETEFAKVAKAMTDKELNINRKEAALAKLQKVENVEMIQRMLLNEQIRSGKLHTLFDGEGDDDALHFIDSMYGNARDRSYWVSDYGNKLHKAASKDFKSYISNGKF